MKNIQKQVKDVKMPVINFTKILAQTQDLLKMKK